MQRKSQRDDGARARLGRRPAGHPRAVAPTALNQRDSRISLSQCAHDFQPGRILRPGSARSPRASNPVRLQDASHYAAAGKSGLPDCQQVLRVDATAGTMGHDEQERRARRLVKFYPRRAGAGGYLDGAGHPGSIFCRNWPV